MTTTVQTPPKSPTLAKYGITEKKKVELDQLQIDVLTAQRVVDQETAIVDSLTTKLTKLEGFMNDATANRAQALANKDLVDEVISETNSLASNSKIAQTEMNAANTQNNTVSVEVKEVIDKLIYSAEVINKLSNLIIRKKASNPLISDELVTMISTAGKDANKAVALTLTALQASYTTLGTSIEANGSTELQYQQVLDLQQSLSGSNPLSNPAPPHLLHATKSNQSEQSASSTGNGSIKDLLNLAYGNTKIEYKILQSACTNTKKQLNSAKSKLDTAQVNLSSDQAGLAAANAAAME
ncbi:MAG: hypothetical protein HRT71_00275 [Flavobacteriales bacterium]|nr:hypothetical protein [Flavobacteriales bacterium]